MNIEEIKSKAPPKATHYYVIGSRINYAIIKRGRVYRIPTGIWIECYENWLKYFRHELIKL